MSLRRTALQRKTQLRRGEPIPRGKRETARRALKTVRRALKTVRRSTGPEQAVRDVVLDRASGCCERCGGRLHDADRWLVAHSFHHRQPRGAGGSSRAGINSPANLLLLCGSGVTGCHGEVEANRTAAYEAGWLVKHPLDPATVPVLTAHSPRPVLLTVDGQLEDAGCA